MTTIEQKIEELLLPSLTEMGYSMVRVKLFKTGKNTTLQLMIEHSDGASINLDDCEKVSREVSVLLDVSDPIKGHYNLEVSSAGLDRPIVKLDDYKRFVGNPVIVKTYVSKFGCKVFEGSLDYADDHIIKLTLKKPLKTGDHTVELSYNEISSARLNDISL